MSITRVGIVGSGIMGAGIAEVAAATGHEVVLRSRRQEGERTHEVREEEGIGEATAGFDVEALGALHRRQCRDVIGILTAIEQDAGGPVGVEVVQLSRYPDGGETEGDPTQRHQCAEAPAGQGPPSNELLKPR